jgi:hypothetical protein
VPGDRVVPAPASLAQVFAEIQAFIGEAEHLLLMMQDDPDEATIERALAALETIRDGIDQAKMFRRVGMKLRDQLVAVLTAEAPALTMQTIGQAAGYGDSFAARVAQRHGAGRRPRKPAPIPEDASAS